MNETPEVPLGEATVGAGPGAGPDAGPVGEIPGGEVPWQRLDPRMLLVHPIRELLKFLPALAGLFVAGTASGMVDLRWQLLGVLVPIGLGLMRYLTTSYRISAGRVELRRGLLNKHLLSTRIDRVRTVDLTSSPIHRVLGLTTVRIGTGTASTSDEDQIDLDGLPVEHARAMRLDLLRVAPHRPGEAPDGAGDPAVPAPPEPPILVLDPAWARYAPVTMTGVVLTGAVIGIGSQAFELVGGLGDGDALETTVRALGLVMVPIAAVGIITLVTVASVSGYLITNWGFTLTHAHRAWHLRRGLITTRETSLDDERVSGVAIGEPLGLRLVGAARLSAIVTGLDAKQSESSVLVPPAPRPVVDGVAGTVVGTPGPVLAPLGAHGPAAVRRRWVRALVPAVVAAAALLVPVVVSDGWGWLIAPALAAPVVAAGLAHDRARGLGHALVDRHLVARSGSLLRQRQVLDVDDVIGWSFRSTWFQRRVGLTTLVATTAGGPQAVAVLDVPHERAVEVAQLAMPHLLDQFTD